MKKIVMLAAVAATLVACGGGGGRPNMANGKGRLLANLNEAFNKFKELLK